MAVVKFKALYRRTVKGRKNALLERFHKLYESLEKTGFRLFHRWVTGERGNHIEKEITQYLRNSQRVDIIYNKYYENSTIYRHDKRL